MKNLRKAITECAAEKQIALDALSVLAEYKKEINNSNKILKKKMEEKDVYMYLDSCGLESLKFSRHNKELQKRLHVTVYGTGFPRVVPTKEKCVDQLTKYAEDMQRNIDRMNRDLGGFAQTQRDFTKLYDKLRAMRDDLSGTAWSDLLESAEMNTILR